MRSKPGAAERSPEPFDKGLRVPRTQSPGAASSVQSTLRTQSFQQGERLGCRTQLPANYEVYPPNREEPTPDGAPLRAPLAGSRASPRRQDAGGTLVTTHRSAPPLCPCSAALFEPVPTLTGIRSEKQRFPQPGREGNVSWGDSRK